MLRVAVVCVMGVIGIVLRVEGLVCKDVCLLTVLHMEYRPNK